LSLTVAVAAPAALFTPAATADLALEWATSIMLQLPATAPTGHRAALDALVAALGMVRQQAASGRCPTRAQRQRHAGLRPSSTQGAVLVYDMPYAPYACQRTPSPGMGATYVVLLLYLAAFGIVG